MVLLGHCQDHQQNNWSSFCSQPLYDNVQMMRLSTVVSPTPNWAKVALLPQTSQPPSDFYLTATNVDEPGEVAYYTTATLPSGASLRRSAYNLAGWLLSGLN